MGLCRSFPWLVFENLPAFEKIKNQNIFDSWDNVICFQAGAARKGIPLYQHIGDLAGNTNFVRSFSFLHSSLDMLVKLIAYEYWGV